MLAQTIKEDMSFGQKMIKEDMSLGQSISGTGETSDKQISGGDLSTKESESILATLLCYKLAFQN